MGEKWHIIALSIQEISFGKNNMCVKEVGSKKITLAKVGGNVKAFAHKCPHASGIMAEGFIDANGTVYCPLHRYGFNLQKGTNVTGEGYFLKTYPVKEEDEGILVWL